MLEEYPDLNLAQVHAALTCYYDHPKEIGAYIAEDEAWDERHERGRGSLKTEGEELIQLVCLPSAAVKLALLARPSRFSSVRDRASSNQVTNSTPSLRRDPSGPRRVLRDSVRADLGETFGLDALEFFGHGGVYDRGEVAPRHERLEPFELVPELLARRECGFVTGFRQRLDRCRFFRSYRRGRLDW